MPELPIDLDKYRGSFALKATEARRHEVADFLARRRALLKHQQDLEMSYLESPAESWHEVCAQALYLIQVLAVEAGLQNGPRKKLVAQTADALARLCAAEMKEP